VTAVPARPLASIEVVAHRGSSDDAPEHTLRAYKRAIEDGADALECDVRLTKDGHLVCVHDRRIDRTSNGRGIVSTLELAELSELDWGSWRDTWEDYEDPEMPDRDRSQILTLRALLASGRGRRPEGRGGHRDKAPHAVRRPRRETTRCPA
jgi:glycerophosphoryl diester phosphodiesterase